MVTWTAFDLVPNAIIIADDNIHYLGKGSKKKTANYPHFVDKRLTPFPPLSTSAEVNNIHTKEFFYPHLLTPPPSPLGPYPHLPILIKKIEMSIY